LPSKKTASGGTGGVLSRNILKKFVDISLVLYEPERRARTNPPRIAGGNENRRHYRHVFGGIFITPNDIQFYAA
jgi:hypothetical protein